MGMLKFISDKLYANDKEVALVESQLGVGQTWHNVKASRVYATTYTNNTGKPIFVKVTHAANSSNDPCRIFMTLNGNTIDRSASAVFSGNTGYAHISCLIPDGNTYMVNSDVGNNTPYSWYELRETP